MSVRVSVLQYEPAYLEVDRNLDAVEVMIGRLETDLLVLPELFATGYFFKSTDDAASVGETLPGGKTLERMHSWARALGATVVGGLVEVHGGRLFNAAAVVGPDGLVGLYRKLHLYFEEKLHFEPGNKGLPVFRLATAAGDEYTLGVMICFDWHFPEAARTLALAGADIIAHPSNLVRPDCPRAMPIRALENRVFTATANRIGRESRAAIDLTFIGQSLISDPAGNVIASLGGLDVGIKTARCDTAMARDRSITAYNDLLADRRTDAYIL